MISSSRLSSSSSPCAGFVVKSRSASGFPRCVSVLNPSSSPSSSSSFNANVFVLFNWRNLAFARRPIFFSSTLISPSCSPKRLSTKAFALPLSSCSRNKVRRRFSTASVRAFNTLPRSPLIFLPIMSNFFRVEIVSNALFVFVCTGPSLAFWKNLRRPPPGLALDFFFFAMTGKRISRVCTFRTFATSAFLKRVAVTRARMVTPPPPAQVARERRKQQTPSLWSSTYTLDTSRARRARRALSRATMAKYSNERKQNALRTLQSNYFTIL